MENKELQELQTKLTAIEGQITPFIAKHTEEMRINGVASAETKAALEKLGTQHSETAARLLAIEQKLTAPGSQGGEVTKSFGQTVIESDQFKALQAGGSSTGKIKVGNMYDQKANLINATGLNQPLVPMFARPGIIPPGLRRLTVRDLLPNTPIGSNLVTYVRELSFTNAAAMQTAEAVAKAQSGLTFELKYSPVQTLAHWIPVSRQLLDDAPAIQGYVNSRLLFGLKLVEEAQLLSGNGSGTNLSGLIANSTTYDTATYFNATDTFIDVLLHSFTQCELAYFPADWVILNPKDWEKIQLIKTTGTASSGEYIFADPHTVQGNSIWGRTVVSTQSMPESQFLSGSSMAAMIWDRNDATIEISREHASFFVENMAAILCEERLGLTIFRPEALIYGGFPGGS